MKPIVKKIAIASGLLLGAAAVSGAVSYAIAKKLVAMALDRGVQLPTSRAHISGEPAQLAFANLREKAAEELESKPGETVEITARDGIKLVGHWRTCPNARRVLIAMHGWRSSWSRDFGLLAEFLEKNGCSVFYAEQRGQNNSGGEYMGFGLTERFDCVNWIDWVNEKTGGTLPIYLCGVSMGASTVLMTSAFALPDNVHGIIADCGYTSPQAIWKHVAQTNLHVTYDEWLSGIIDEMCKERIHFSSTDYSCTQALADSHVPVLFIHGTDDTFVPVEMTYENYKACVSPKRLLVVPGAGHGMSYVVDRKLYEQAVLQFWHDFDGPSFENTVACENTASTVGANTI